MQIACGKPIKVCIFQKQTCNRVNKKNEYMMVNAVCDVLFFFSYREELGGNPFFDASRASASVAPFFQSSLSVLLLLF